MASTLSLTQTTSTSLAPEEKAMANSAEGTDNGTTTKPALMQIEEHPIENHRPMRVICIGAGFSGIYMGIRIPERLRNVDLQIYEKNEGVGGTWFENRYPGVGCDIPAHVYVYDFEPKRDWSGFYAGGAEIRGYLEGVAEKYGVNRFVKCGHKVRRCEWDNGRKKWMVDVKVLATGDIIKDEADFVVSAMGGLNSYAFPDIEGLWDFEGKVMHSAAWDESVDFKNKKIGVIGAGSSAVQIIPSLQKVEGTKLSCFIRGKTWIAAPFGDRSMQKLDLTGGEFTDEAKEKYIKRDEDYHKFRKLIETEGNSTHGLSIKNSEFSEGARKMITAKMKERLQSHTDIAERLIPNFAVGCRRLTPGPGFLEALVKDNVEYIPTTIARVTKTGIELSDGRHVALDAIVCSTGFNVMAAPECPVIGLDGATLAKKFDPWPCAYLSVAIDQIPNYMLMLGPNSGIGTGSLTKLMQTQGDYIVRCIRKLQRDGARAMHVKPARVADWSAYIDAYFPRTVFLDECRSWYRSDGGDGNRIVGLWPGSNMHAVEALRSVRWEDYEYEFDVPGDDPVRANRLAWLGDGWSELQLPPNEGGRGDVAYYLEPEFQDYPAAPLPEKTKQWNMVSFAY